MYQVCLRQGPRTFWDISPYILRKQKKLPHHWFCSRTGIRFAWGKDQCPRSSWQTHPNKLAPRYRPRHNNTKSSQRVTSVFNVFFVFKEVRRHLWRCEWVLTSQMVFSSPNGPKIVPVVAQCNEKTWRLHSPWKLSFNIWTFFKTSGRAQCSSKNNNNKVWTCFANLKPRLF